MANWSAAVVLLALCGILVSASTPEYVENVRERSANRIVSGWEAEDGQFPHQLLIRMVNSIGSVSSCGGSIIHSEWGLTAAHCTATRPTIVIRAGLVHVTRPQYIFETTTWFNHPLYNNNLPSLVQPHDIGLLKFGRNLTFGEFVQPVRLQPSAHMNRNYDGVRLIASGWGRTWTNGATPENLNWVYLLGDSNFDCWVAYSFSSIIVDSTICASGYNVTSQSTCQGDSGGPMSEIGDDGVPTQVGIASFVSGTGCHTPFPAGFIRPGHYHEWYEQVTGINFDWDPAALTSTVTEPPTTRDPVTTDVTGRPTTRDPVTTDVTDLPTTRDPVTPDVTDPPTTRDPVTPDVTDPPTTRDPVTPDVTDPPTTRDPVPTDVTNPPTTRDPVTPDVTDPPTTRDPVTPDVTDPPTTRDPVTPDVTNPPTTRDPVTPDVTDPPTTRDPVTPDVTDPPTTRDPVTPDVTDPPTTRDPVPTDVTNPPTTRDPVPTDVTNPPTTRDPVPTDVTALRDPEMDTKIIQLIEETNEQPKHPHELEYSGMFKSMKSYFANMFA